MALRGDHRIIWRYSRGSLEQLNLAALDHERRRNRLCRCLVINVLSDAAPISAEEALAWDRLVGAAARWLRADAGDA